METPRTEPDVPELDPNPGTPTPPEAPLDTPVDTPDGEPETTPDPEAPIGRAPVTPLPGAPGSSGPLTGPSAGPALPGSPRGPGSGPARQAKAEEAHWESWWEHNKERLLARKPVVTISPDADAPFTPRTMREARDTAILPLLRTLAMDGHCGLRATAILSLGKVGDATDLPLVVRGLGDVCPEVRQACCLALGQLGGEAADLRLLRVLRDGSEAPRVRAFAAAGLGLLHSPATAAELARVMTSPEEPEEVRASAALALGFGPDPSAAAALELSLRDRRTEPRLRSLAAHSLGRLGHLESVKTLVPALADKAAEVRRATALALGAIRYRSEAEASLEAALERQLAWQESGTLSREAAAELDGSIRDLRALAEKEQNRVARVRQEAVRALLGLVESDSDLQTRAYALVALGEIGARDSLPVLDRILRRSHHPLKAWAGIAAGLLGDEALAPSVRKAFDREEETASVRGALAVALGLLADAESAPELRALAADAGADAGLRGSALTALALLGDAEGLRLGKRLLEKRTSPEIRRSAALALGLLGQQDAAARLGGLIATDPLAEVRSAASLGLGYLREAAAADDLARIAADPRTPFEVRIHAIAALGYLGARSDGPPAMARFAWHYDYRTEELALERLLSLL